MPKLRPMDVDRFWGIVESARGGADRDDARDDDRDDDREGLHERLAEELRCTSPEEVASFQARLDMLVAAAYRWDLWGAAYVLGGGCSDDAFEYFRLWLVSQGRRVYQAALADPESLDAVAGAMDAPPDDGFEDEEFGYVASGVYDEMLGGEEMPWGGPYAPGRPAGEPFEEDPDALARRYPRLTAVVAAWGG